MLLIRASLGSHLTQSHLPSSHNKQTVERKLVLMIFWLILAHISNKTSMHENCSVRGALSLGPHNGVAFAFGEELE